MGRHLITLALACLLAACGGQATAPPAPTAPTVINASPTASSTATPTAIATPKPAPTPTAAPVRSTPRPTLPPTPRPTAPPPVMTASISAVDFGFRPATVTVRAGTRITFTNRGAATHTFTANAGLFNSGDVASGQSYSFTFMAAGTYVYHCQIHPMMTGTVTVTR
jgi:plastocyanin